MIPTSYVPYAEWIKYLRFRNEKDGQIIANIFYHLLVPCVKLYDPC